MADALPNFTLEVSLESHDPLVRHAFGKHYGNEPIERTLADALDVGARRLDVFFMSGLPQQTAESVSQTSQTIFQLNKAALILRDSVSKFKVKAHAHKAYEFDE